MLEYTLEQWATACMVAGMCGWMVAMGGYGFGKLTGFQAILLMVLVTGLFVLIPGSVILTWARYPYP